MREKDIERAILVECSGADVRLFKNEVGSGYRGSVTRSGRGVVINPAVMIRYGLCTGSSDIIGWKTVEITPEMVGQRVAIFTALEVKSDKGCLSKDQERFLKQVQQMGGIASVVRSVEDAKQKLKEGVASLPPLE